jgi:hypothetical protein
MVGIVESLQHFISNGKDSSLSRSLNHHTQPTKITLIDIQFKRGLFWTYPTLKAIKIFIGRPSQSTSGQGQNVPSSSTALPTKRRLPLHGLISALIQLHQPIRAEKA